MRVKPLTAKAIRSIRETEYLNVWEGAVRSGKTVASSLAWIAHVEKSPETHFLMSGKTIKTLFDNVIGGDFGMLAMLGSLGRYHTDTNGGKILDITTTHGVKTCHCVGANDERAYEKIRGITVGAWYADEVSQQPLSFIEEAFRRTIASRDRRHFWTLNPETPHHYIYKEYIDVYSEKPPSGGFKLWKFLLDDNLAITEERKNELRTQYSGVFYRRYILGERVIAEGAIYDMMSEANFYSDRDKPEFEQNKFRRSIAVDYGTTNACVFLDCYFNGKTVYIDREYRWDSVKEQAQKTDSEYAAEMEAFIKSNYGNPQIIVDPSAASFIVELKRRQRYVVQAQNDVLDGIRTVATLFQTGKLKINRDECKGLIAELQGYAWDSKAAQNGEEKPIKQRDHGADALRYYCYTDVPTFARSARTS